MIIMCMVVMIVVFDVGCFCCNRFLVIFLMVMMMIVVVMILIFVIENSLEVSPPGLWAAGLALVVIRAAHAVGMQGGGNQWRVIGTAGTWFIMVSLCAAALLLGVGVFG